MNASDFLEEDEYIKPTLSKKGVMLKKLNQASKDFIVYAQSINKPVLDIGAAYGNTTLPVLKAKKHVVACDCEQSHLDEIAAQTPAELKPYLSLKQGKFPADFEFPENHFGAAILSYILHFLKGEEVLEGLKKVYTWLMPQGKIFINVGTPYLNFFIPKFRAEYERRLKQGERWPGTLTRQDMETFSKQETWDKLPENAQPEFFHVFTKEILGDCLENIGFIIKELYYNDLDLPEKLLTIFGGDGRGSLSAIATKAIT